MKKQKLFEQFPPVTTEEWTDKINADLKGADFNKRLVWKTGEGFDVMPFYRKEDIEDLWSADVFLPLYLRGDFLTQEPAGRNGSSNNWLVRQNIIVRDYQAANEKALSVLMKGVDSLGFVIEDPTTVTRRNFEILLNGIHPEGTEVNFLSIGMAREIISIVAGILEEKGYERPVLRGAVEADPLGRLMLNGTLCIPVEAGFDYLASITRDNECLPSYRNIQVNGSNFVNAGAGVVTELAFSLSMAAEYLAQLTDRGIESGKAAKKIRFSFGTGSNYFMEIAKLRAARILWVLIADAFGIKDKDHSRMEIHSVTGRWNKTNYDPYVNMLRTQTEAMSAILGGTDSLTVEPFDTASGDTCEFSERIARNQQLILKEEAYFDKVADPSSGSYYIENLTARLADSAWKLFITIEEKGGFVEALKSGMIQDRIEQSATERIRNIGRRKEILLGTNQFPNPGDKIRDRKNKAGPASSGKSNDEIIVRPVRLGRGAEEFETIRKAVDSSSRRPAVFLLSVGNNVMRRARAQFSSGFFGCAGYTILDNDGFDRISEGIEEALRSEADIVVLCSSDEEYALFAKEVVERLGGKTVIVVAGNPPDIEDLKAKGLVNFISIRSDIAETLKYYNTTLGVESSDVRI